jgi:hypothetical protein
MLDRGRRHVVDEEQLAVDLPGRDAELTQDLAGRLDQREGPAQPEAVDVGHRDESDQDAPQPVGIEAPAEQLDVPRLTRQHVDDLEAGREPVLQVGHLVGEHDRARAAVSVEQRHIGLGVREQR